MTKKKHFFKLDENELDVVLQKIKLVTLPMKYLPRESATSTVEYLAPAIEQMLFLEQYNHTYNTRIRPPTRQDADENENVLVYRLGSGWVICKWHTVVINYLGEFIAWKRLPAAPSQYLEDGEL